MSTNRIAFAALLAILAPAGVLAAGYPSPKAAGFHNCALIYDRPTRTSGDLSPYVAYSMKGKPQRWMFDAFLFLIQNSGRGVRTEYGDTQKVDWEYHLSQWFGSGRDLEALDASVENASKTLGPPPSKRQVLFSVPWVSPAVKDFGDVNGDGVSEDLSTAAGRDAVLKWYTQEVRSRFQAAGYKHLNLWGFYWMREDLTPNDPAVMGVLAKKAHAAGERVMWIPYHRATGWDTWKDCGVDVAIHQPNYAFTTRSHGGRTGRNRLGVTAQLARSKDMGVEIEAFNLVANPSDRRVFLHYLAEGAATRSGYQSGASAFYLSTDLVEQMAASGDPDVRRLYDALALYVSNKPVPDPDPVLTWKWTRKPGVLIGETKLPKPAFVGAVEVYLNEPAKNAWRGTAGVAVTTTAEKGWSPGGWAIWASPDTLAGRNQLLTIPVGRKASRLRLTLRDRPGVPVPSIRSVTYDGFAPAASQGSKSAGRPYRVSPAQKGKYGDTGRTLADGVIPNADFSGGGVVGWHGASTITVAFDLGKAMPVSRIEAHCEGGGIAAVNWPGANAALFSVSVPPPSDSSGFGALSDDFVWMPGSQVTVDRQRSPADQDGHITYAPRKPVSCRYVTLMMEPNGWIMLKEIRIFSGGVNVAPKATYALRPLPNGDAEGTYADDGVRLTDGVVAQTLDNKQVVGWNDDGERRITVDLGRVSPVKAVTAWALKGGQSGVKAPKEIAVDLSVDGQTWRPAGTKKWWSEPENGQTLAAVAFRVAAPPGSRARYVRVRATRNAEWAMLSEIEVE